MLAELDRVGSAERAMQNRATICNPDGSSLNLTPEQFREVLTHAMAIVYTGVDLGMDIWAIQWDRDYTPSFSRKAFQRS